MSDKKKNTKRYLSMAFHIAAFYAWPFYLRRKEKTKKIVYKGDVYTNTTKLTLKERLKEAAKDLGRLFIVLPAKIAAVLLVHQLIQPATGTLFPTGEEYLESQGIDPIVATQLSDTKIRVRERDFWGKLHAAHDIPTLIGVPYSLYILREPAQAYAIPPLLIDQCRVVLQEDTVTAKDFISLQTGIPKEAIENVPLSDKESRLTVTFHEFSHCNSGNILQPIPIPESDADVRATLKAVEVFANPEIAKTFLYARAMSTSPHDHDTALYLDARLRGVEAPRADEMAEPTDHAFKLADIYIARKMQHDVRPDYIQIAYALKGVLKEHGDLLSDLGKRRAELYIEAVEYFVPSAFKPQAKQNTPAVPANEVVPGLNS